MIEPNDPFWDDLVARAQIAKDDPTAWLEMRQIYGNLADEPRFADAFAGWLRLINEQGARAALERYLAG